MTYWEHELRIKSEELAFQADKALNVGEVEKAKDLYRQAAKELEELLAVIGGEDIPKFKALVQSSIDSLNSRIDG